MPGLTDPQRAIRLFLALVLVGALGCEDEPPARPDPGHDVPSVALTRPERGPLRWTVRQPGRVEAFEHTAVVPRVPGYVQSWEVDIGDRIYEGEILAVLSVPALLKERQQRAAEVNQARRSLDVAEAHLASARAAVEQALAGLDRSRAGENYRQLQHRRVNQLLDRAVVNKQVEEESRNELQAAEATVEEARAGVHRARADLEEGRAVRDKARADIEVAEAALGRMEALVSYATLRAPYDGIVTARNIHTGNYVQPPAGAEATPLYVVERRDLMRIFVEVPERDAVWVKPGCHARIEVPALVHQAYSGTVKRTSYSLIPGTRTLQTEIDLPNPDDLLRPGMYVRVSLQVERPDVLSLPSSAVGRNGNVNEGYQYHCFVFDDGRVHRTLVRTGSRGERRVEVLSKRVGEKWVEFSGNERVVEEGIATLTDGQMVK